MASLLAASAMDQNFERFAPLLLFLVGLFILFLRWRDRRRGPDEDEP